VLQTEKGEEKRSENYRDCNRGFFPRQGVSTDLPALIDSKIRSPEESMKDFLDYFSTRKYKMNKGYSVEWVAKKIQWSVKEEAIGILKVWAHSLRTKECTEEKLRKLNEMTDDEVLSALKALEEPSVLRKMGDKQLNTRVYVTNFIQPYLHQFFDDSHGLKASLKPLRRPFD